MHAVHRVALNNIKNNKTMDSNETQTDDVASPSNSKAAAAFAAVEPPSQRFQIAVDFITTGGSDGKGTGVSSVLGFGQQERLEYYKYYKQYTVGDIKDTKKPTLWNATMKAGGNPIAGAEALMKYDAWTEVKGMNQDDAVKKYIDAIVRHTLSNGREQILLDFIQEKKSAK